MSRPTMIENISRALILKNNQLLVCNALKAGHYYLPGGHIEFGESAEKALKREMIEECDTEIKNIKFVGCFENKWGSDPIHHEYNMLFSADVDDMNIVSKENHIAFEWVDVLKLSDIKFYPEEFLGKIVQWRRDQKSIYLTTIKE